MWLIWEGLIITGRGTSYKLSTSRSDKYKNQPTVSVLWNGLHCHLVADIHRMAARSLAELQPRFGSQPQKEGLHSVTGHYTVSYTVKSFYFICRQLVVAFWMEHLDYFPKILKSSTRSYEWSEKVWKYQHYFHIVCHSSSQCVWHHQRMSCFEMQYELRCTSSDNINFRAVLVHSCSINLLWTTLPYRHG